MSALLWLLLTSVTPAWLSQATAPNAAVDPAAKPGIYADTGSGFVPLTTYLEPPQESNTFALRVVADYLIPPGFTPQAIDLPRRFVMSSSDAAAEWALNLVSMRMRVIEGTPGLPPVVATAQMSKKVRRVGVNLFQITSAELDPVRVRKTVAKLAREKAIQSPVLFLDLDLKLGDGRAPRLYVVQIAL